MSFRFRGASWTRTIQCCLLPRDGWIHRLASATPQESCIRGPAGNRGRDRSGSEPTSATSARVRGSSPSSRTPTCTIRYELPPSGTTLIWRFVTSSANESIFPTQARTPSSRAWSCARSPILGRSSPKCAGCCVRAAATATSSTLQPQKAQLRADQRAVRRRPGVGVRGHRERDLQTLIRSAGFRSEQDQKYRIHSPLLLLQHPGRRHGEGVSPQCVRSGAVATYLGMGALPAHATLTVRRDSPVSRGERRSQRSGALQECPCDSPASATWDRHYGIKIVVVHPPGCAGTTATGRNRKRSKAGGPASSRLANPVRPAPSCREGRTGCRP